MRKHTKILRKFSCALLIILLFTTQAFALEVPVSQTEQMIDGRQTLVKVFEVDPSTDPNSLIENDLAQNGYRYKMTSIVKDVITVKDEEEVTQEYEVTVNVSDEDKARLEALMSMPAFIEYEQEGYEGKLYPIVSSLSGEVTGRTNHSGRKTTTKKYTYDYNDDSLVPKSNNGYSLSSITWAEGAYMPDTAIPSNYVATATYSKPYSYSTIDGWTFTMSYVGDVKYEAEDTIRYTVTYIGEVIEEPGFFERLFGSNKSNENAIGDNATDGENAIGDNATDGENAIGDNATEGENFAGSSNKRLSVWKVLLGLGCLAIAVAALAFGIKALVKFIRNNRVTIYARDEVTGDFNPMKSVWFNSKSATITIDILAAPATQHFRVALKSGLASQLQGKVVTVKAGQRAFKHTIGVASGTDYTIDVNLEAKA